MPIIIRDETANALILTIDNSGNMAFGDGTPINMLTLAGYGIIDSQGQITHGLGSTAGVPVSGGGNLGIGLSTFIPTISGRIPNVQVDTTYPAAFYFMEFQGGDPANGGSESVQTTNGTTVHYAAPVAGGFNVFNQNTCDGFVNDPSSPYYDASLSFAPYEYRWL